MFIQKCIAKYARTVPIIQSMNCTRQCPLVLLAKVFRK